MGVEEAYPVPRSALLYIEARGGEVIAMEGGAWSQAGVGWHAASEGVARDGTGLTGAKRRRQPFGVGFGWSKLANEALWARRVAVVQGPVVFAPLERGLSLSLRGRDLLFVRSSPGAAPVRIALRLHHRPFSSRCETKAALATSSAASTVATETKHAGTRTFPYSRSTGFCRSRQPFLGT